MRIHIWDRRHHNADRVANLQCIVHSSDVRRDIFKETMFQIDIKVGILLLTKDLSVPHLNKPESIFPISERSIPYIMA